MGELRRGTAQRLESGRLLVDHVRMDPEQLVAQLAELRTQNQQLHQASQQVQQQQSQQQGLVQALSDLPQSLAQTVGATVLAAARPARANPTLVDTKGLGKPPPLRNTESEFVSWARRTENFVVSVHPGARDVSTWAVERESAMVTASNAATEVVMPLDTLRMLADQLYTVLMTLVEGESIVRHPRGLWIWRRSGSLAASTQTLGPLDDWKSERIVQRNPFTWTCQAGRAARSSGTIGGLVEELHAKKRRTEWSAPYVGRRHQDGGVGRRHCQLQRSRTYQKLSGEVVLYAEARGYVAPKLGQVSKAREDRDDPMDVEGFGQWKGRTFSEGKRKNSTGTGEGKGTGKDGAKSSGRANTQKIQGQCWSCGKTGHQSKDCWARPQQQSQGQSNSIGKGNDVKGKSGKGGGKKGKSKYVEALVWNQQPSPVASSVASSTPQTETARLTRLSAQRLICARLH